MAMEKTLTVFYDGEVLRPEGPIEMEPNQRYQISYQAIEKKPNRKPTAWEILRELAGTVEAPPDWSEEHDHYIHGTPKRGSGQSE